MSDEPVLIKVSMTDLTVLISSVNYFKMLIREDTTHLSKLQQLLTKYKEYYEDNAKEE